MTMNPADQITRSLSIRRYAALGAELFLLVGCVFLLAAGLFSIIAALNATGERQVELAISGPVLLILGCLFVACFRRVHRYRMRPMEEHIEDAAKEFGARDSIKRKIEEAAKRHGASS